MLNQAALDLLYQEVMNRSVDSGRLSRFVGRLSRFVGHPKFHCLSVIVDYCC
jgi:hypothetical protein